MNAPFLNMKTDTSKITRQGSTPVSPHPWAQGGALEGFDIGFEGADPMSQPIFALF